MGQARFDVTTFGEMLLRLSVPAGQRLETATNLDVHPAGAEANVATLLGRLERRTCWAGALPRNALGRLCANHLRAAGVDLGGILWRDGGRLGTYYVEFGELPRGVQVTYDRAGSEITMIEPSQVDCDMLLDTRLLHLTGITPALSGSCLEITTQVLQAARDLGVPVSFDINYRQKLWSEAQARAALLPMIQELDLLFCSRNDAMRVFGCEGSAEDIVQAMLELSHAKNVIITLGQEGAMLWDGKALHHEPACPTRILDRLGAGDALAAGVIDGWLEGDASMGLRQGVILAALALSQRGDMVTTNRAELNSLSDTSSALSR